MLYHDVTSSPLTCKTNWSIHTRNLHDPWWSSESKWQNVSLVKQVGGKEFIARYQQHQLHLARWIFRLDYSPNQLYFDIHEQTPYMKPFVHFSIKIILKLTKAFIMFVFCLLFLTPKGLKSEESTHYFFLKPWAVQARQWRFIFLSTLPKTKEINQASNTDKKKELWALNWDAKAHQEQIQRSKQLHVPRELEGNTRQLRPAKLGMRSQSRTVAQTPQTSIGLN